MTKDDELQSLWQSSGMTGGVLRWCHFRRSITVSMGHDTFCEVGLGSLNNSFLRIIVYLATEAIVKKSFFFFPGKFWAWNDISLYLLDCLVAKKVRENRKEKKIFFYLDFFYIIADVDVLMWIFLIPRMETRESGKGNPRKCWGFHFNGILVILIIGLLGELGFTHNNWVGLDLS